MTESDLRATLGENLRKYRSLKGFSQARLAEMLDISPNFISDMENGKRWLSSDTLVNLAIALDVEAHEFLLPPDLPKEETVAFIHQYTQKAASMASNAVIQSLDELRKQFLP